MAHKLGLMLGQINRRQYNILVKLKLEDPAQYEKLEYAWGTTRKQLERKYGKAKIAELEGSSETRKSRTQFRTRKSGKRYPIRSRGDTTTGIDTSWTKTREKDIWGY